MTDETKRMKVFTYQDIESWEPCYSPGKYLPKDWRGTALDILDDKRIPFADRLWVVARTELVSKKLLRLFAVWCARQVQHLMQDERSKRVLDVAEAFANGMATEEELAAAWAAAAANAEYAAAAAANAEYAAWSAANAAWSAVATAAATAARDAQNSKLREMLIAGIETGDTL